MEETSCKEVIITKKIAINVMITQSDLSSYCLKGIKQKEVAFFETTSSEYC